MQSWPVMGRFDAAVIGAGIVGASVAYHLAKGGLGRVAVLERERDAGMGSTAKAAGGIRAQFSSGINIELSRRSIEHFERFSAEMGVEAPFHQVGYLWVATTAEEMRRFEGHAELQRRHGLKIEVFDRAGVERVAPFIRTDDVVGGTFHDKDGYASPADHLLGYQKKAAELGVEFLFKHDVTGREGKTLRTSAGAIEADRVVVAAGAWSGKVGELLGVELPVQPVRRQCFTTEPLPDLPHPVPMVVDISTGVYLHSESKGLLVGRADRDEPPGFNEAADYDFLERTAELAMNRVPSLEQAGIGSNWAGLYEVTPDHHPILGEIGPGLFAACGFSGHGVMHAPAAGALVAELILEGQTSMDIAPLGLKRFRDGKLINETNVI